MADDETAHEKTFAVLVEYRIPDGGDLDSAVRPLLEAIRELSPVPPSNVTAFADDAARLVITVARTA